MIILKSIRYLFLIMFFVSPLRYIAHCSCTNMTDSGSTNLDKEISEIKSQISQAKSDFGMGSFDWSRYGNAVLNIFSTENDMVFVSELIDWLLRGIPDWDVPKRDIQQFMSDTECNPDLSDIRFMLLNLLLVRAKLEDHSKPEFTKFLIDPMPTIRKRMIQVLNDDGTMEAIPAIEKAIDVLKKSKTLSSDIFEINLLQDSIRSIQLWDERSKTQWVPSNEEIRQQCERILEVNKIHFYNESPAPPSNLDGSRFIIDRWQRFKWGAKYILETEKIASGKKNMLIKYVICKLQSKDWDEAFSWIMSYYHDQDHDVWQNYYLMDTVLERNSADDLHRLSKMLTSEDPTDRMAIGYLIKKYGEIGTAVSLPELQDAAVFWKEKEKIGTVQAIEKAIQSIEQRLGITQAVNPVHSSE